MTWIIRTDRDFDRALQKLDRQVATRVLKALTALENLDDCQRRLKVDPLSPVENCPPLVGLVGLAEVAEGLVGGL